jgi:uncharacterized membrane protein (DUF373 family)
VLETLLGKIQRFVIRALAILLMIVVVLSTAHLAILIAQEIWKHPRFVIEIDSLLEIFGYFLLVLIGVELLETLKGYLNKETIHVRVVLEVALIAMARKAIIQETNTVSPLTLVGFAAIILALAIAFYFERNSDRAKQAAS